jgi:phosphoserine phosphatase RsbU/P
MELRQRIAVAALLGCGVITTAGIGMGEHRAHWLEQETQVTYLRDAQGAWNATLAREAGALQRVVLERVSLDDLARGAGDGIHGRQAAVDLELRERGVTLLQMIQLPGPALHSSPTGTSGFAEELFLEPALAREVAVLRRPLTGLLRTGEDVVIAAAVPVPPSGASSAAVLFVAGPVDGFLAALRNETGVVFGLADAEGKFLADPPAPPEWVRVVSRTPPETGRTRLMAVGDRVVAVTDLPLTDMGGQRIGFRRLLSDDTARQWARDTARLTSVGTLVALFCIIAAALLLWLRSTFRGLESALQALQALARGDTTVQIEGAERRDGVGAAARALRVFRQGQIALQSSMSRSQRRRLRQLRYIEGQLDRLSATLGPGERVAMQEEIRRAGSAPDGTAAAREDALDALAVALRVMVDRVSTQHLDLQRMLAEQSGALATQLRMQALEREMSVVADMQARLAPTSLPGKDRVAVRSRLLQGAQFGGDFLDFFWLDAGQSRLALMIGSVEGGGLPSAFLAISARALVRALAGEAASPGACLARISDLLVGENEAGLALKVLLAVVDLPSNLMVIARAGLPSPITAVRPGEARVLDVEGGPPLALRPGARVPDTTVPLQDRMMVLLFSPGLTAARRGGLPLGIDGVREAVAQAADLDVEPLLTWMADQVTPPMAHPEGDMSMVALRLTQDTAPAAPTA